VYRTKEFEEAAQVEVDRWQKEGKHIPTQAEIDEVTNLLIECGPGRDLADTLTEIHLPSGVGVHRFSEDLTIVYWKGDPAAQALIAADIENLPELLTCTDPAIRQFAKQKLEILMES